MNPIRRVDPSWQCVKELSDFPLDLLDGKQQINSHFSTDFDTRFGVCVMKAVSYSTCDLADVGWSLHLLNGTELVLFSHQLHDSRPDAGHRGLRRSRRMEKP